MARAISIAAEPGPCRPIGRRLHLLRFLQPQSIQTRVQSHPPPPSPRSRTLLPHRILPEFTPRGGESIPVRSIEPGSFIDGENRSRLGSRCESRPKFGLHLPDFSMELLDIFPISIPAIPEKSSRPPRRSRSVASAPPCPLPLPLLQLGLSRWRQKLRILHQTPNCDAQNWECEDDSRAAPPSNTEREVAKVISIGLHRINLRRPFPECISLPLNFSVVKPIYGDHFQNVYPFH